MLHPIFSVLIARPELVINHLAGYAALAQEEASVVGAQVARRAIAWVVAVLAFVVFLVLSGTAIMLGMMQTEFHWVLLAVPSVALLVCALAWNVARQRLPFEVFPELKAQLDADVQALHTVGAQR